MSDNKYIPKIIHFIWFGGNPYSPIIQKCINSWEKYCPDYEIKLWNEDTFDINSNAFVLEAYKAKKWAFVSDYVRLYALYEYGGVYLDTDVEVLKPLNTILENAHAVTGYSTVFWIPAGLMAAERHNIWIKDLLDYYTNRHFIKSDGSYDMKENNAIITEISKLKFGFKSGDMYISKGKVTLYPLEYFTPYQKKFLDYNNVNLTNIHKYFNVTKRTYCIHYATGTWDTNSNNLDSKIKHLLRSVLPQKVIEQLQKFYYGIKYRKH